jgi:DNA mismatch repair endonuclease MutH
MISVGIRQFDENSVESISGHAKAMSKRTLCELMTEIGRNDLLSKVNKGAPGHSIQAWFGVRHDDNRPEPDLPNAVNDEGVRTGLEIKAVPLKLSKKGKGLTVKERTVIGMIDYFSLLKEKWTNSHARQKLACVLFVYYSYNKNSWQDSKVEHVEVWNLRGPDEGIMNLDWDAVRRMVDEGKAHELTEKLAKVLSPCTKGVDSAQRVPQPKNPEIPAKPRAFSLKAAFLRQRWLLHKKKTFESIAAVTKTKAEDFEITTLARLHLLAGLTLRELSGRFEVEIAGGKQAASILVKKALGFKNDKALIEEFEKTGIEVKAFPVRPSDKYPWEAVSFPAMKMREFEKEEWEDSELEDYLDCILFIPILSPQRKTPALNRKLGKAFFWRPSNAEWEKIKQEWKMFQNEVIAGKCKTVRKWRGKKLTRPTQLSKASDTDIIHIRPHSTKGEKPDIDSHGNEFTKQCFWLNKGFLQKLLIRNDVDR